MKYIVYNKSKLNEKEICDFLKDIIDIGSGLEDGQWQGIICYNGLEAELLKSKNNLKIVIKGEKDDKF